MTERALSPLERALVSACVAYCTVPASGLHPEDGRLLARIATICDAVAEMSMDEQVAVQTGPVQHIYGDAVDLVTVYRARAPHNVRKKHRRYLACHVLMYFELRSVRSLRGLGLPDHVPEPVECKVF